MKHNKWFKQRLAVSTFMFVQGIVFASWASRIPDVKDTLRLSDGQLGQLLFAIPLGQVCMMALSGVLVSKWGSRSTTLLGVTLYLLALLPLALASSWLSLFIFLFFFGTQANLCNIAVNTQASACEQLYRRPIMSSMHGMWSLGGLAGGMVGAAFAEIGASLLTHYTAVSVVSCIAISWAAMRMVPADAVKTVQETGNSFSWRHLDTTVLVLGLLAFGGMFCEGILYDWSSVYFASELNVTGSMVRIGYIAGMTAMTVMRFTADKLVQRYSARYVLRLCGLSITAGLLMAVGLPYMATATLGFLLVGMGIACTVPICYSVGGKLSTIPASIAITIISSISFFGFMVGPPLIGLLADIVGLSMSLATVSLFGIMIFVMSRVVKT